MRSLHKYSFLFFLGLRGGFKNYKALFGLSLFLITSILIFFHMWKLSHLKLGTFSFDTDKLLWYIALNEWVLISLPDVHEEIETDLRSGKLAYLLPRPMSYLGSIFASGLGQLVVNLTVLGAVTFFFTKALVTTHSFGVPLFLLSLLFGLLGGVLGLLLQMIVGLSAFWLEEVGPFHWIWEKLLFTLGGLILPLAAYPYWLEIVAYLTPFPVVLGGRSALLIDFHFSDLIHFLLLLVLWSGIALFTLRFLYKKGLRILNLEGG